MPPRQNEYVREFVKNVFDARKTSFLNNNQPVMGGQGQHNATRAEGLCERIFMHTGRETNK